MLGIEMQRTNMILMVEDDLKQCATYLEKKVEVFCKIIWDK